MPTKLALFQDKNCISYSGLSLLWPQPGSNCFSVYMLPVNSSSSHGSSSRLLAASLVRHVLSPPALPHVALLAHGASSSPSPPPVVPLTDLHLLGPPHVQDLAASVLPPCEFTSPLARGSVCLLQHSPRLCEVGALWSSS